MSLLHYISWEFLFYHVQTLKIYIIRSMMKFCGSPGNQDIQNLYGQWKTFYKVVLQLIKLDLRLNKN